jgi:translation initiation factor 1 (eIF-1/SUI1)
VQQPDLAPLRGRSASGWTAREYEIDLNGEHAQRLRDALAAYVRAARRVGGGPAGLPAADAGIGEHAE